MFVKAKDTVVVLSGNDAGKQGKVLTSLPKANKVVVEGVAMMTKHQKSRAQGQPGGIIHKDMPIDASNVMLICPKCSKPTRVSHKVNVVKDENGKAKREMIRVCKKCQAEID